MRKLVMLGLCAAGLPIAGARAEPLDKAACEAMRGEYTGLIAAGLKTDMEKGPDWGKTNLPEERLKLIQRLIEVEESLAFRCRTLNVPIKRRQVIVKAGPATAGEAQANPTELGTAPAKSSKSGSPAAVDGESSPSTGAITPGAPSSALPVADPPATAAPKPTVIRLKPKKEAAKRKPPPAPVAEKPGLFDFE